MNMRNRYYSIIFLFVALVVTSCKKDFLDRTPSADLDEERVFKDRALVAAFADNAYNHLIDDYARFNAHRGTTAQLADEAVSGNTDVAVRTINQGLFHDHYERGGAQLNDIGDVWDRAYAGIRVTNVVLTRMKAAEPNTIVDNQARVSGEMHFIRAFLYFELIKRFGGVPIIDQPAGIFDDVDVPRNTYQECLDFILADLDAANVALPPDYSASSFGRATIGAAAALRARVLLYAASPLNNPSNDLSKWAAAATAAERVMGMGYGLQASYDDIMNVPQSSEYIMIKIRAPRVIDGFLLDFVMSPGSGGAQGSMNPTQNHVDMYEAVKWSTPPPPQLPEIISSAAITDANSGYEPQKPYENRDPRFYANILYNDASWQGRRMGMWSQTTGATTTYGADFRPNNIIYSATRYYCRKMWPEVYVRNATQRALFNFIFFRYAEVLLNYAEAINESEDSPTNRTKALDQLNLIRDRVGMPNLPNNLTQAQLRDAIVRERAVELAFEDFRWYDLIRWKKAKEVLTQPMKAMDVVRNANGSFTYNVVTLPVIYQRRFDEHMYLYPIPRREIFKSNGILIQNPSW